MQQAMEPGVSPGRCIEGGQECCPLGPIESDALSMGQGFACTDSRHHGASTAAAAPPNSWGSGWPLRRAFSRAS
jgi:hypothetical protein